VATMSRLTEPMTTMNGMPQLSEAVQITLLAGTLNTAACALTTRASRATF
jgi:hypothetical protein